MSTVNSVISAPVDLVGDVAAMFNCANYDVAYLCSNAHGGINPASKIKPIRFDSYGELQVADFRGSSADIAQGIYYGVKIAATATKWTTLHDSTLTYYPPVPGTDYCRLTDFDGYDHKATYTPQGKIIDEAIIIGNDVTVILKYDENNTTGVNIADMTGLDLANGLKDFYPCVLVSNAAKTLHYVRALNRVSGTNTLDPSTFYVDGSWYPNWSIPMTGSDVPSILEETGEVYVTVFLAQAINVTGVMNLNSWTQWTTDRVSSYNAFAFPGATNIKLDVQTLYAKGIAVNGAYLSKGTGTYYVLGAAISWVSPVVGNTYTVSISYRLSSGGSGTYSNSYTAPSNYEDALLLFSKQTTLVSIASGTTGTYTYTVTMNNTTVNSGSGTLNIL